MKLLVAASAGDYDLVQVVILPDPIRTTIIADRGFGRTELLPVLKELGFGYIIRVRGHVEVDSLNSGGLLEDYPVSSISASLQGSSIQTTVTWHATKCSAYCVLGKRARLALALYCFLLSPDSYLQMTLRALNDKPWHRESAHLGSDGGVSWLDSLFYDYARERGVRMPSRITRRVVSRT